MNAQYDNTLGYAVNIYHIDDNGTKAGDGVKVTASTSFEVWCKAVATYYELPPSVLPGIETQDEEELESFRHLRLSKLVSFAGLGHSVIGGMVEAEAAGHATYRGPKLWGDRPMVAARGYYAGEIQEIGERFSRFITVGDEQPASFATSRAAKIYYEYKAKIGNYTMTDVARIADIKIGRDEEPFVAFWSGRDGYLDRLLHLETSHQDRTKIVDEIVDNLENDSERHEAYNRTHDPPQLTPPPDPQEYEEPRFFAGTDMLMGLAPPGAQVGDWVIKFMDCDAAVVVRPLGLPEDDYRTRSYALVGRADVADIEGDDRQSDDMAACEALFRDVDETEEVPMDKRMDMIMSWRTLARLTAAITLYDEQG